MFRRPALLLALAGVLACGAGPGGEPSAGARDENENVGRATFGLSLATGIDLDVVTYVVQQGPDIVVSGHVPVANGAATVSVQIGDLETGDYEIMFGSQSTDGEVNCTGSSEFSIAPRATTQVTVDIKCSGNGALAVPLFLTDFTECTLAVIETYSATTLQVSIGGQIGLASTASPIDGQAPDFLWSATAGEIANPNTPITTYECTEVGTHTISLMVGHEPCFDSVSFDVTCAGSCGDGLQQVPEVCDQGSFNGQPGSSCGFGCTLIECGDGALEGSELCDDGNSIDTDSCRNDCTFSLCGNGIVDGGEDCDPPDGASCSNQCQFLPCICGDGIVCGVEECDPPGSYNCNISCEAITPAACLSCEQQNSEIQPYVLPDLICNFWNPADLATDGPAAGTSRRDLCYEMLVCIRATECAENGPTRCYCGSSLDCTEANGDCRTVVERSLETTEPLLVAGRFDNFIYGGAGALVLGGLDSQHCQAACFTDPSLPLNP